MQKPLQEVLLMLYYLQNLIKEACLTIYEKMLAEHKRLENEISSLQSQLKSFPDGKLICVHNGTHYKWFHSDGHTQTYIPKKNREFAEQLAIKKYLSVSLEDLEHEKTAIEFYLRHHQEYPDPAKQLLDNTSGFKELLTPYFKPISQELLEWMNSPFEKNNQYPELLIHKTISGNYVRSKSEVLIDMSLHMHNIPFRYECALYLNGTTFYPDFTIRHPDTGEYYYWEHFGLMDDESYIQKTCSKLCTYSSNGIIPSIHLITTYETKENPLSLEMIEKTIEYYFL